MDHVFGRDIEDELDQTWPWEKWGRGGGQVKDNPPITFYKVKKQTK